MSGAEIIHGDALDVLPRLRGRGFAAVVTDPPYCSGGMLKTLFFRLFFDHQRVVFHQKMR